MKMKILTFILFTLFFTSSFSQDNKGYYGAKFYVSLESILNTPIIYNLIQNVDNPSSQFDKINYGYRFTAAYVIKRNIAFGLELGTDYSNITHVSDIPNNLSNNPSLIYTKFMYDNIGITTFSILPKIEFANSSGLLPLGLSHQIGFGISNSTIKAGSYHYESSYSKDSLIQDTDNYGNTYTNNTTFYESVSSEKNLSKTDLSVPVKMYTLMYALNVRTAISKKILLSYGFRYTLNGNLNNVNAITSDAEIVPNSSFSSSIARQRRCSIISFNLGLTYAF